MSLGWAWAQFYDMGTGTPGSPVFFMEYAGARPRRRRLVPVKEEHNIRVTFSPNLIGSRDINLLPSDFNHYIVSLKRHLFLARYESIYQGDQYDIPEVTRVWAAFVTVRDKYTGSSQTRFSSPPRLLPRSFKPALTRSHNRTNCQIRHWLSQFENCRTINLWTDDPCVRILSKFFRAQALHLYNISRTLDFLTSEFCIVISKTEGQ